MKRALSGILLLDKPTGMSSNAILQTMKRLFQAKKAGHTGSLDPLATGMLPICFGEATKFSQFLLEADKTYRVRAQLGVRTDTSDSEGEVVETRDVPALTTAHIEKALEPFRGESQQIPSMYSALKYQGKPLYKYAREGVSVPRTSRPIHVYALTLIAFEEDVLELEIHCSKGTYVRTIVDDLGEALGCGAHVIALRRLSVSGFEAERMVTVDTLNALADDLPALDHLLLPITEAVSHLPALTLSESAAFYLMQGQAVQVPQAPTSGWVSVSRNNGEFLGMGEINEAGLVAPKRLISH